MGKHPQAYFIFFGVLLALNLTILTFALGPNEQAWFVATSIAACLISVGVVIAVSYRLPT